MKNPFLTNMKDSEQYETIHIPDLKADVRSFSKGLDKDVVLDIGLYPRTAKLQDMLDDYEAVLNDSSRTGKLRRQYFGCIDVVKNFSRAESTGDFNLYLTALDRKVNLFAATVQINYAKSARLHLQQMLDLHHLHSWLYT